MTEFYCSSRQENVLITLTKWFWFHHNFLFYVREEIKQVEDFVFLTEQLNSGSSQPSLDVCAA